MDKFLYKFFKGLYYLIPFKKYFFLVIRLWYRPSDRISGYLKFNGIFKVFLEDGVFASFYNDHSTLPSILFWKGLEGYEPVSLRVWIELSKRAECIFDLGSNFGLFGIIAKAVNPASEVIFFEPLERNVARINRNLKLNKMEGVVEEKAVSDRDGTVSFYDMDSLENTIGSIHKEFVLKHEHHTELLKIDVPVVKLDTYIKRNSIERIDLIKIDVEGADAEVLKGFSYHISIFKPVILLEVTDQTSASKINTFILNLPFTYFIYELSDTEGIMKRDDIDREVSARNFLLSLNELNHLTL